MGELTVHNTYTLPSLLAADCSAGRNRTCVIRSHPDKYGFPYRRDLNPPHRIPGIRFGIPWRTTVRSCTRSVDPVASVYHFRNGLSWKKSCENPVFRKSLLCKHQKRRQKTPPPYLFTTQTGSAASVLYHNTVHTPAVRPAVPFPHSGFA